MRIVNLVLLFPLEQRAMSLYIEICKHGNGQNQAGSFISIGVSSIKSFSWQKNKRAEQLKYEEKETKKLQDNVQSLQLRLTAREHICRGLQDKVRDLEFQLAEERKTIIKQETRALATASSSSTTSRHPRETLPTITEKKPPL